MPQTRRGVWSIWNSCSASSGDSSAPKGLAALRHNVSGYSSLLRAHIDKENNVLFPMADQLVSDREAEIQRAFDAIERERVGEGKHEAYHEMLTRLKAVYGV